MVPNSVSYCRAKPFKVLAAAQHQQTKMFSVRSAQYLPYVVRNNKAEQSHPCLQPWGAIIRFKGGAPWGSRQTNGFRARRANRTTVVVLRLFFTVVVISIRATFPILASSVFLRRFLHRYYSVAGFFSFFFPAGSGRSYFFIFPPGFLQDVPSHTFSFSSFKAQFPPQP